MIDHEALEITDLAVTMVVSPDEVCSWAYSAEPLKEDVSHAIRGYWLAGKVSHSLVDSVVAWVPSPQIQ